MKEVVHKEVLKWLDVGVIYPISDNAWVSPDSCHGRVSGINKICFLCSSYCCSQATAV